VNPPLAGGAGSSAPDGVAAKPTGDRSGFRKLPAEIEEWHGFHFLGKWKALNAAVDHKAAFRAHDRAGSVEASLERWRGASLDLDCPHGAAAWELQEEIDLFAGTRTEEARLGTGRGGG
jgi:hypothetical protein